MYGRAMIWYRSPLWAVWDKKARSSPSLSSLSGSFLLSYPLFVLICSSSPSPLHLSFYISLSLSAFWLSLPDCHSITLSLNLLIFFSLFPVFLVFHLLWVSICLVCQIHLLFGVLISLFRPRHPASEILLFAHYRLHWVYWVCVITPVCPAL